LTGSGFGGENNKLMIMKKMKNYAIELSYRGRHSDIAQKIWGEGHTKFINAISKTGAKIKALEQISEFFKLDYLKATVC
jgi:hypothetical protein